MNCHRYVAQFPSDILLNMINELPKLNPSSLSSFVVFSKSSDGDSNKGMGV